MNYEGKYYDHKFWDPRMFDFSSIHEIGIHENKAINSIKSSNLQIDCEFIAKISLMWKLHHDTDKIATWWCVTS